MSSFYLSVEEPSADSCPRKFDVLKTNKYSPEMRNFEGKYASFKNIKFPRGNYQTDSFET